VDNTAFAVIAFMNKRDGQSIKFPWFILLFVLAIIFANSLPEYHESYLHFKLVRQERYGIALFLIGSNINIEEILKTGPRSFALGIVLWAIIASGSLLFLMLNVKLWYKIVINLYIVAYKTIFVNHNK
jgi:uncharacterized membrane protein YadS